MCMSRSLFFIKMMWFEKNLQVTPLQNVKNSVKLRERFFGTTITLEMDVRNDATQV